MKRLFPKLRMALAGNFVRRDEGLWLVAVVMSEAQALGVLVGELLRKQITPKLGPGIKVQVACQGSEALGQSALKSDGNKD